MRVQRDHGDEYLFELHTLVVLPDGGLDEKMAEKAAREFSLPDAPDATAEGMLSLQSLSVDAAYGLAKAGLEKRAQFWDWDEDMDLIGVAKLIVQPKTV